MRSDAGTHAWTVGAARAVIAEAMRHLQRTCDLHGVTAIGFGLREGRPACIVGTSARGMGADLPDRFGGFDVVREVERIAPAGYSGDRVRRALGKRAHRAWPGWPGCAVRADGLRKAGTLGCYVRTIRNGIVLATTCEHVLSGMDGPALDGQDVSAYVAGEESREISFGAVASVERVVGTGEDSLDVSLVAPSRTSMAVNSIPKIGTLARSVLDLDTIPLGTRVCKYGAASGYTVGIITAVQNVVQLREDDVSTRFTGLMEITPDFDTEHRCTSFCSRGDSGAIVALRMARTTEVHAIGHLMARGTLLERGYAMGLDRVLSAYNLTLV